MLLTKKNTNKRANVKRGKDTPVIVTKSTTTGASPFAKKIKKINTLLEKAKLLS